MVNGLMAFVNNIGSFLGGIFGNITWPPTGNNPGEMPESLNWVKDLVNVVDIILLPLMILVLTAGSIYAVVLGVNFARAESTDKREEAKKRMINAIIGVVSIFVLILLLNLVIFYMPAILGY